MPVYLTEYGYFATGHRALPAKTRTRYLQQALLDRAEELARQEPAAVPAGVAAARTRAPRSSTWRCCRRAARSTRSSARCSAGSRRTAGKVKRPGGADRPAGRAGQPGPVSVAARRRARAPAASPALPRGRGRGRAGARARACAAGSTWSSCATRHADDETLLRAAAGFRALCDEHGALFWLNDRPDLARAAGADGVHVGQDDAPVGAVREQVGPDLLIGLSTHSPEQFDAALGSGADQLSVGPVWETPTKAGPPGGRARLRALRGRARRRRAMVRDRRDRPR